MEPLIVTTFPPFEVPELGEIVEMFGVGVV